MKLLNFIRQMTTDRYDTVNTTARATWTGMTIYQINGATRKELAMYSTAPAKKVARQAKHAAIKKKPTSELNERGLTMQEREQFMQAKSKELKSFFENGVSEFVHMKNTDPSRTLSSRMLLKWSKNDS